MAVLILGATSPIARALGAIYAQAGEAIFLAARDAEEAERIAADLAIRWETEAASGAFDATAFEEHSAFLADVERAVGPVEVAIVAFGDMGDQEAAQHDFARAKRVIDVNYTGAVSICEVLAERMSSRGRGAIVGISSVAGDRGRASNYLYGSAKGAFSLYLQGLRNRLFARDVHVMTVKLGFVDTRMTFGMETGIPVAAPEDVAEAVFDAQQRGVETLYYPRFWAGIMGVIKAIPEKIFKRLNL